MRNLIFIALAISWCLRRHFIALCAIQLFTTHFSLNTKAQAPQGIPYQAIARNASGVAIANTAVKVRFSIRDSIATGAIKYQETHNLTTSALGLFSVNVGMGTVVSGTFSGINWGKNAKFLQVELNTTGGTTYTDLGTTQMMSVPYALFAEKIANSSSNISSTFSSVSLGSSNGDYRIAVNYCRNLVENGFDDWRLPSLEEWNNGIQINDVAGTYFGWTTTYASPVFNSGATSFGGWWIIDKTTFGPRIANPAATVGYSSSIIESKCIR